MDYTEQTQVSKKLAVVHDFLALLVEEVFIEVSQEKHLKLMDPETSVNLLRMGTYLAEIKQNGPLEDVTTKQEQRNIVTELENKTALMAAKTGNIKPGPEMPDVLECPDCGVEHKVETTATDSGVSSMHWLTCPQTEAVRLAGINGKLIMETAEEEATDD